MKFTYLFITLSLLLTACRTNNGGLDHRLVGTWTKDKPVNPDTFTWIDPVSLTYKFSSDGSFFESFGHRSVPVVFQGTWLIQGTNLAITITNAYGTENYQPAPGQIGKILHWQIIRVDEHQLICSAGGSTNLFIR